MAPLDIAKDIFESLRSEFPHLSMEIKEASEDAEIELSIPVQDGLDHEVLLNLQNVDELHFNVDDFWGKWSPCTESKVTVSFHKAVQGFLSGKYRIVVYSRKGKSYKRLLQSPVKGSWHTEYTHVSVHWPCFNPQERYVQNGTTT
ncbi:hypothetical protein [Saccharospirillum alexandrii]|uniref:hypothetical protein n=1 Tax=Saccharospirillum alexandrii TaxID=2448477 RepID=UPI000FD85B4F|nr:hypothetical protein [Saccharospirillum alexandrii]